MQPKSPVTSIPAAAPEAAVAHFQSRLSFETDCWDVNYSIENDVANFILLDVRSPEAYAKGHIPQAINLPTAKIRQASLPTPPDGGVYVVYCAGPHCNGANKAALRLAKLGFPVKEMIGGAIGWVDEGFQLVAGDSA